jgi:tetratricopeptide (TPR) repeat protein
MGLFNLFKKTNDDLLSEEEKQGKVLMEKGMEARVGNDFEKALSFFNRSLEIKEHPAVYLNRGAIYQMLELFLQARSDYLRAIEMENMVPTINGKENIQGAKANLKQIETICSIIDKDGGAMRNSIQNDGVEYAGKRISDVLMQYFLNNKDEINYFVLCELKELYDLGGLFRMFAQNSGINYSMYSNPVSSQNISQDKQNSAFNYSRQAWGCLNDDLNTAKHLRFTILELLIKHSSL